MDNHPLRVMHLSCYGKSKLAEELRVVRKEKKLFSDQGITINDCYIAEQASEHNCFHIQVRVDGGGQSFVVEGWVNNFFLKVEELSLITLAKNPVSGKKDESKTVYIITIDKTLDN